MDDLKQEVVTVQQPELKLAKESIKYYPSNIFHNQAAAASFACVTCLRISNKCYNNEENNEFLCPECAQKAIENGIKCVVIHTIQKMINNLTIKCMNNDEQVLMQRSADESDEVEGSNVGIVVCAWSGKLKDWSSHSKNECILIGIECPFAKYGCTIAVGGKNLIRAELQEHMRESEAKHLLLQMKLEMQLLQKSLHELKIENTELKANDVYFLLYFQPIEQQNISATFTIINALNQNAIASVPTNIKSTEAALMEYTSSSGYCMVDGRECQWFHRSNENISKDLHLFFRCGGDKESDDNICYVIENELHFQIPRYDPQRNRFSLLYSKKRQSLVAVGGYSVNGECLSNVEELCLVMNENENDFKMDAEQEMNSNRDMSQMQLQMKWKHLPSMKYRKCNSSSVLIEAENNKIFVCGGWNKSSKSLSYTEIYDFGSEEWTELKPMLYKTQHPGICSWTDKQSIIIVGGADEALKTASIFNIQQNTWQSLPDTNFNHKYRPSVSLHPHSIFADRDLIVVAGNHWEYSTTNNTDDNNQFGWGVVEFLDIRDCSQKWNIIGDIQNMTAFVVEKGNKCNLQSLLRMW